jgi:8-oxo-dGTP diphosphatase
MKNTIHVGVCFFCHDSIGRFLIAQRSTKARDEYNKWDCGGGALHLGEMIEEAVSREVLEEYCCEPLTLEFLGYRTVLRHQDGHSTHWIMFDFKVEIDETRASSGEPEKCQRLRWVTLEEFEAIDADDLHSQLPDILRKYRDRLLQHPLR